MQNLQVRLTTKEDYPELVEWWKYHRWGTPPSLELLDNLRFGIVISLDGENICAGFIYFTNAKAFGILEYIVSTYKVRDKKIRSEALKLLLLSLCDIAKQKGVKSVISFIKNDNLINHYKESGFVSGGSGYTSMIKTV